VKWAALLAAALVAAASAGAAQSRAAKPTVSEMPYLNAEYGFAALVPAGVYPTNVDPHAPDHGVRLYVAAADPGFVWVDGTYNVLDWVSPDDALAAQAELLKDEGATGVAVTKHDTTTLGGLPASEARIAYTDAKGRSAVERLVVAIRKPADDGPEVVLTVGLDAPTEREAAVVAVYDAVRRSFRVTEPGGLV
jgi:hypothetical protein